MTLGQAAFCFFFQLNWVPDIEVRIVGGAYSLLRAPRLSSLKYKLLPAAHKRRARSRRPPVAANAGAALNRRLSAAPPAAAYERRSPLAVSMQRRPAVQYRRAHRLVPLERRRVALRPGAALQSDAHAAARRNAAAFLPTFGRRRSPTAAQFGLFAVLPDAPPTAASRRTPATRRLRDRQRLHAQRYAFL